MIHREKAVHVRGLTKQYGRAKKSQLVLDSLDMNVDKGTIYGLLGASGCGKTTLLSCIVGRRSITAGEIWVLGGKPGTTGSGVPGPRLGYMPQEIALMREFTIKDALHHFGWIYGMKNEKIEEKFIFLSELLDLPPANLKIKHLSGGQQRRVSLAVALVHDPELLILDEPTVGLDPVLRQSIWDYLLEIATKYNKTIIITTHYIEEARQAHKIGLMRSGKLLAEDSPERLLRLYNCSTVEEVFLRLSTLQEKSCLTNGNTILPIALPDSNNMSVSIVETNPVVPSDPSINENGNEQIERIEIVEGNGEKSETTDIIGKSYEVEEFIGKKSRSPTKSFYHNLINKVSFTTRGHVKALLSKNWYRITRHPGAIIFVFFFPMLELCTFYFSVGGMPDGLKLGIVNEELGNFSSCTEYIEYLGEEYGGKSVLADDGLPYCLMQGLSCKFLESFNDTVAIKVNYPDRESAMKDAKAGELIAVIHFIQNFSTEFEARLDLGNEATNETVINSELPIWMDMSRRQSALLLEQQLREIHKQFLRQVFTECNISPEVGSVPMMFFDPVYGSWDSGFSQFMTPGVVITMIFFLAVSVTATIMVVERLDGIWDRTQLAGVSSTEILLSHIVIESGVITLQVTEVIIFVFFIFGMPCKGNFFSVIVLLVLQGLCGMCGGFLVSVSCDSITSSNLVSMGSFYPVLVLSGLLWPTEGMPEGLRSVSIGLPTTQATTALRNIMEKGWGITDNYVYQGYLITLIWIISFCVASIIVVKMKK